MEVPHPQSLACRQICNISLIIVNVVLLTNFKDILFVGKLGVNKVCLSANCACAPTKLKVVMLRGCIIGAIASLFLVAHEEQDLEHLGEVILPFIGYNNNNCSLEM